MIFCIIKGRISCSFLIPPPFVYQAKSGDPLSKTKILRYLLEGTPASNLESMVDEEKEATENSKFGSSAGRHSATLYTIFVFLFLYLLL